MHTILSSRPSSYRLVILGALLVGLVIATVAVGLATSRTVAATTQLAPHTTAASAAYIRYADMKERQAEQRDSAVAARASSIALPGPRERYEAMKEQQAARRDASTRVLVATAPSAPLERYLAMKEQQAARRDASTGARVTAAPLTARERYLGVKERQAAQRDATLMAASFPTR